MNTLNQALQAKFPHLEVSVLKLSEAQKDNETKRMDSEFFRKVDLAVKNKLAAIQSKYLFSLVSSNSRYSQPNYDKQSSLKIINSQYIRNEFIDYENAKCGYGAIVPKEAILINSTGVGTLGRVNINLLDRKFSIDSHINVLIVKDKNELNPCYLMIFLQTKYGQSQINRYYSGTSGQIEIYPRDFNNFLIPLLPMDFQLEIEKLVKDSHLALEQSKALYKEAEDLLYTELGLNPQNPMQSILQSHSNDINFRIATLKQTLGTSGRLDSEYYQSKYEKNEAVIKSKPYTRLKDIVEIKKSIEPGSEAYRENGIPFIRVSNLSPFSINQSEVYLDSKDFKDGELESLYPQKDTILLSKDGSIGIAYYVEKDLECVTSGAILHLKIKKEAKEKGLIAPQYLTLVLNALTTKLQAQRDSGGSIIAHWKISEIENLLIPLLELSLQKVIESKITQSLTLRAEAKALLEEAKAKVEQKISLL